LAIARALTVAAVERDGRLWGACSYTGVRRRLVQEELLSFEQEFTQAVAANDAAAIARFVADDWVIVDADGSVIDKSRFISVIESGALTHESMESTDVAVRVFRDTAVVTGITTSKGQFMGQSFTTRERATDVLARLDGRWLCIFSPLTRVGTP
jgi:ketosteroid isomerase-like protein